MRRSMIAILLTGLVVLVAGGAAAALNARVLDASVASPVGGLASYLPSTSPSGSSDPAAGGAIAPTSPLPDPTTSITPDSVEDSTGAAATDGTAATDPGRATAASGRPRATGSRTSSARATYAATSHPVRTSRPPRPTSSVEPGDDHASGSGSHSDGGGRSPSPSRSSDD